MKISQASKIRTTWQDVRQVVIANSEDKAEGDIVVCQPGHNFRINGVISNRAIYHDFDRFYPPIPE